MSISIVANLADEYNLPADRDVAAVAAGPGVGEMSGKLF